MFSVTDSDKETDVISSQNDKMQDMVSLTLFKIDICIFCKGD